MGLAIAPASSSSGGGSSTITLAALKAHLNIEDSDTDDDTELAFFLDAASAWVATKVSDPTISTVQMATLELVRHLWDSQRGPAAGPLDQQNDGFTLGPLGFAVPNRVAELLEPFLIKATPTGSFPTAGRYPDPIDRCFG